MSGFRFSDSEGCVWPATEVTSTSTKAMGQPTKKTHAQWGWIGRLKQPKSVISGAGHDSRCHAMYPFPYLHTLLGFGTSSSPPLLVVSTAQSGPNAPPAPPRPGASRYGALRARLGRSERRKPPKVGGCTGESALGIAIRAVQPEIRPFLGFDAEPARLCPTRRKMAQRGPKRAAEGAPRGAAAPQLPAMRP